MKRGFTLVEILVALCLLGAGAAVMVAPLYTYAQSQGTMSAQVARNGIMEREADRLLTTPFDSLDAMEGCRAAAGRALAHTRCLDVQGSGSRRTIRLIVTPQSAAIRPDTVVLERGR